MNTRTTAALAAALLTGLTGLAGCGNNNMPMPGHSSGSSAASSPKAGVEANQADVDFATMMIPHHEQALMMVTMSAGRPQSPEFAQLLQDVQKAQTPEITLMRGWVKEWTGSEPKMGNGMHSGHGMMDSDDMSALMDASDEDYERVWLESMITHHQGAIDMSKTEIAEGKNPDAIALARSIVKSQSAEIEKMRNMLKG